jgi:hypothetical protein
MPTDQMSIFSSYIWPFRISGDTYRGVPQNVLRSSVPLLTAQPKSHSLMVFYNKLSMYVSDDYVLRLDIPMQNV